MCRWIAYRGDTIALEHYVTAPAHSLIEQSIRALESTASINGDGFGLGWYGDHPEPGLYREVRPAWSDENLRYLCRHIRSSFVLCACARRNRNRRSRGRTATHSCAAAGCSCTTAWSAIGRRLRRKVEALVPDELYPLRTRNDRFGGRVPRHHRRRRRPRPGRRYRARARGADQHGHDRRHARTAAVHGRAGGWTRSLCLPLCGERQRKHALLPRRTTAT